jgi:hypothetical protein
MGLMKEITAVKIAVVHVRKKSSFEYQIIAHCQSHAYCSSIAAYSPCAPAAE